MPKIEVITVDARPTYEQVEKWYREKTNVMLHNKGMSFGIPFENRPEGIITYLKRFDNNDGALKLAGEGKTGMYIRDIVSYSETKITYALPEEKIILSKDEALKYPTESKLLVSGNYSVYVSKILLSEYSEYFRALFKAGMKDKVSDQIDLTYTISSEGLQMALVLLQKLHNKENTYSPFLCLSDALELIVNADLLCSQQLSDLSFVKLESSLADTENEEQLDQLLTSSLDNMHPLISNMLAKLKEWKKRYQHGFPWYVFKEYQVITSMPRALLHMTLDDYELKMMRYATKLSSLTKAKWFFNGIELCSERVLKYHPLDHRHNDCYTNTITALLINRGIILGRKCKSNDRNPNMTERWACSVTNETALFAMNANKLRLEVDEASSLIHEITGYPCDYLHIWKTPDNSLYGRIVEPLATVGGIVVGEYYGLDVSVIDYNLKVLRLLKRESISLKKLTERCQAADRSKPIFDQVISPERQAFHLENMEKEELELSLKRWNPEKELGLYFSSKANGSISQRKVDSQSKTSSELRTMRL